MIRAIIFGLATLILLGMYAVAISIQFNHPLSPWTIAIVLMVSVGVGYAFHGEMP